MFNVLFMGTPDFAKESLEQVYNSGYNILGVVTNVDKPKGRGMKMIPSPVKEFALEKNIPIYQPEKVRKNIEFINKIKELNPDVICVVAYGKILPKEILDIPKFGCINVHGSLLPKYRGAAPIQWAVLNGDKTTGITTMYMNEGMDTGDMILKEKVEIGENETTGELWERLSKIGGKLLVETLKEIEDGTAPREKQGNDFTVAPMLNKEMSKIDWENKTAEEIKNLVRGLNPIMGAYTFLEGKKIKFWRVECISDKELFEKFPDLCEYKEKFDELYPGTILFSEDKVGLYIKTIKGNIKVTEIQGENAKKMQTQDFLRGNKLYACSVFE
nr:methionyl-tRNA formyltransferase [Clostridia bacterium]